MASRLGVVLSELPLRVEWEDGEQETLNPALFDDPLITGERFWVDGVWGNFGLVRVVQFGIGTSRADAGHRIWPDELDIG